MRSTPALSADLLALCVLAKQNPDRTIVLVLPSASPTADLDDARPGDNPDEPDDEPDDDLRGDPHYLPTMIHGEQSVDEAGPVAVVMRLQQELYFREVSFLGTTEGRQVRITAIFIGDEPVFVSREGVPVEVFADSALRKLVSQWRGRPGLDLRVVAVAAGPARLAVAFTADRPAACGS